MFVPILFIKNVLFINGWTKNIKKNIFWVMIPTIQVGRYTYTT